MIYLIQYDRDLGDLITFSSYQDADRLMAESERLQIELELLASGVIREVVLLEAKSVEELRKTHRRYFESLEALIDHAWSYRLCCKGTSALNRI